MAVLAYSAQFAHPLTAAEVEQRLLTRKALGELGLRTTAKKPLKFFLEELVKDGRLIKQGSWFTLVGNERAFGQRKTAETSKKDKQRLVEELVGLVKKTPWVSAVVLTGSCAVGGAGEHDDVDFLMITKTNRLWLTRLWLLLQSWFRGRRPHLPGGDISHSWDLNFWLTEERLALPPTKRTLYEAYEVLQTQWVFDRDSLQQRFYQANPWVSDYLLTWKNSQTKPEKQRTASFDLLNLFDWLAFYLQIGYRTLRHGHQRADKHGAFFHPRSTRGKILKNWRRLYRKAVK